MDILKFLINILIIAALTGGLIRTIEAVQQKFYELREYMRRHAFADLIKQELRSRGIEVREAKVKDNVIHMVINHPSMPKERDFLVPAAFQIEQVQPHQFVDYIVHTMGIVIEDEPEAGAGGGDESAPSQVEA
jgi:restriction endonuclease